MNLLLLAAAPALTLAGWTPPHNPLGDTCIGQQYALLNDATHVTVPFDISDESVVGDMAMDYLNPPTLLALARKDVTKAWKAFLGSICGRHPEATQAWAGECRKYVSVLRDKLCIFSAVYPGAGGQYNYDPWHVVQEDVAHRGYYLTGTYIDMFDVSGNQGQRDEQFGLIEQWYNDWRNAVGSSGGHDVPHGNGADWDDYVKLQGPIEMDGSEPSEHSPYHQRAVIDQYWGDTAVASKELLAYENLAYLFDVVRQSALGENDARWNTAYNADDLTVNDGSSSNPHYHIHDEFHDLRKQIRAMWRSLLDYPAMMPMLWYPKTLDGPATVPLWDKETLLEFELDGHLFIKGFFDNDKTHDDRFRAWGWSEDLIELGKTLALTGFYHLDVNEWDKNVDSIGSQIQWDLVERMGYINDEVMTYRFGVAAGKSGSWQSDQRHKVNNLWASLKGWIDRNDCYERIKRFSDLFPKTDGCETPTSSTGGSSSSTGTTGGSSTGASSTGTGGSSTGTGGSSSTGTGGSSSSTGTGGSSTGTGGSSSTGTGGSSSSSTGTGGSSSSSTGTTGGSSTGASSSTGTGGSSTGASSSTGVQPSPVPPTMAPTIATLVPLHSLDEIPNGTMNRYPEESPMFLSPAPSMTASGRKALILVANGTDQLEVSYYLQYLTNRNVTVDTACVSADGKASTAVLLDFEKPSYLVKCSVEWPADSLGYDVVIVPDGMVAAQTMRGSKGLSATLEAFLADSKRNRLLLVSGASVETLIGTKLLETLPNVTGSPDSKYPMYKDLFKTNRTSAFKGTDQDTPYLTHVGKDGKTLLLSSRGRRSLPAVSVRVGMFLGLEEVLVDYMGMDPQGTMVGVKLMQPEALKLEDVPRPVEPTNPALPKASTLLRGKPVGLVLSHGAIASQVEWVLRWLREEGANITIYCPDWMQMQEGKAFVHSDPPLYPSHYVTCSKGVMSESVENPPTLLIVAGGIISTHIALRNDDSLMQLIKATLQEGQTVGLLGSAQSLLLALDVAVGARIPMHTLCMEDLINAGYINEAAKEAVFIGKITAKTDDPPDAATPRRLLAKGEGSTHFAVMGDGAMGGDGRLVVARSEHANGLTSFSTSVIQAISGTKPEPEFWKKNLTPRNIAIAMGVLAAVILIVVGVCCVIHKRRQRHKLLNWQDDDGAYDPPLVSSNEYRASFDA